MFATPLANGVTSFGMWVQHGSIGQRPDCFHPLSGPGRRGRRGCNTHLGVVGVTGIPAEDLQANPLDLCGAEPLNTRRLEVSAILDSTNPDLSAFQSGGKLIVVIDATTRWPRRRAGEPTSSRSSTRWAARRLVPSPGFACAPDGPRPERQDSQRGRDGERSRRSRSRTRAIALADHGLGRKGTAPGNAIAVTAGARSLPMCSYPGIEIRERAAW
jgi:feruloyl esterase